MEQIYRNRHIFETQYTSQEDQHVPIASYPTPIAPRYLAHTASATVPEFMAHTVPTLSYGTYKSKSKRRKVDNGYRVPDIEEEEMEEPIEVPTFEIEEPREKGLKRSRRTNSGGKQFKKHTRKYKKKQNKKTKHRGKKTKKHGTLKKLRYKKHTKRHHKK